MKYFEWIGHREIVGHGEIPYYTDSFTVPCPAIRFREVDEALGKLREKEKGDWKLLSLEDKKTCKHKPIIIYFLYSVN